MHARAISNNHGRRRGNFIAIRKSSVDDVCYSRVLCNQLLGLVRDNCSNERIFHKRSTRKKQAWHKYYPEKNHPKIEEYFFFMLKLAVCSLSHFVTYNNIRTIQSDNQKTASKKDWDNNGEIRSLTKLLICLTRRMIRGIWHVLSLATYPNLLYDFYSFFDTSDWRVTEGENLPDDVNKIRSNYPQVTSSSTICSNVALIQTQYLIPLRPATPFSTAPFSTVSKIESNAIALSSCSIVMERISIILTTMANH